MLERSTTHHVRSDDRGFFDTLRRLLSTATVIPGQNTSHQVMLVRFVPFQTNMLVLVVPFQINMLVLVVPFQINMLILVVPFQTNNLTILGGYISDLYAGLG